MESLPTCFVSEPLIEPVKLIDIVEPEPEPEPQQKQQNQKSVQGNNSSSDNNTNNNNNQNIATSRQSSFVDKASLTAYLDNDENKNYTCRYISICQRNSFQPLQITEEMLGLIKDRHDLSSSLWDVSSVFYIRNLKTEQVYCVPYATYDNRPFVDISYTIRYPEYKIDEEEWTIRQTGVYHRVNIETSQSTIVLFNPTPNSKLHCKVQELLLQHTVDLNIKSFLWVHQQLFATYIPAWRQYIASLERRFLPIANTAAATYINEELRIGHGHLGTLISIQRDFLQIPTILTATTDVITRLESKILNIQRQCEVYSRTAVHLKERVQMTAQLLADTLLFRDQVLTNEQNGNMLQLNKSAVFLTTLTLLYLPASFLTSFFGMNFFAMNQDQNRIVGTPMIWIFVVSAILLTATTFTVYYWLAHHDTFFLAMAPKKWRGTDIRLRNLTRRLTGSQMNAANANA